MEEVAVKAVECQVEDDMPPYNIESLDQKAVLHSQSNRLGCETIVHLQGYQYCEEQGISRFFLEYVPHGDLECLLIRHKARNT